MGGGKLNGRNEGIKIRQRANDVEERKAARERDDGEEEMRSLYKPLPSSVFLYGA